MSDKLSRLNYNVPSSLSVIESGAEEREQARPGASSSASMKLLAVASSSTLI
jgi:hypothetical protein